MSKKNSIDLSTFDTKEKILETVSSLKSELQNLKLRVSFDGNDSKGKVREIRKNIARLLTKLNNLG